MVFDFISGKKKGAGEGDKFSSQQQSAPDAGGHCMISGNLTIKGDVQFAGTLRLDGRVNGKVTVLDGQTGSLVLSKGAVINGPVTVTNMLADGTVNGEINVTERIECRANAVIRGDVHYQQIHIADGARIEGRCLKREGPPPSARPPATTGELDFDTSFLATRQVKKS